MKVVVAIDRSPVSETLLQMVASRPWPANATFCVLNVVDVQRFERLPAIIEDAERESIQIADLGARQISASGYEAFPRTTLGNPRVDITCYAKEWGADLVLVGSNGHSGIARFLLGSVALAVVRTAPCSVEIVRQGGSRSPLKVLFATDGSEFSSATARLVAEQVWPKETLFKILSVEELMTAGNQMDAASLSAIYPASLLEELVTQAHSWARLSVSRAKDVLGNAGLAIAEDEACPVGDPRGVILDTAKDWGADLIIVGSHGRRGFGRWLMGSVSEAVAIHAECSVRVVRPKPEQKGNSHAS